MPPDSASQGLAPVLDAQATAQALPFRELVDELRRVVLALEQGRIICPDRLVVPMADRGLMLSMPAVADDIAVHKLITVTPANASRGLPTIRGQVSVLDVCTGRIGLVLDGPTVTGRRTAAMSLLGLHTLRPETPRQILIIGTGTQSRHHVDAIAALHPTARVSVRGSSPASSERFCKDCRHLHPSLQADDGSNDVDLVITCTTSRLPVYAETAAAHRMVIAVGAFQPDAAEIAAATVQGSAVYVDEARGARHEAGDLLLAGIDWSQVLSLAHAVQHGPRPGAPLLFKTVGCAAWDLAAARVALRHAAGSAP